MSTPIGTVLELRSHANLSWLVKLALSVLWQGCLNVTATGGPWKIEERKNYEVLLLKYMNKNAYSFYFYLGGYIYYSFETVQKYTF